MNVNVNASVNASVSQVCGAQLWPTTLVPGQFAAISTSGWDVRCFEQVLEFQLRQGWVFILIRLTVNYV